METDDAPIFRYIYRNFAPRRHLEFGTWKGEGTCYVLEESAATVWTLNAPLGERDEDGAGAYGAYPEEVPEITEWIEGLGLKFGDRIQSDTVAMIGRKYLARNLGSRVCQIYSDSREWDVSNYPDGFFDTVLIDGGHDADVVLNDTRKALRLVRSGGLVMWHDFCPDDEIVRDFATCAGVVNAIRGMKDEFAGLRRVGVDRAEFHSAWNQGVKGRDVAREAGDPFADPTPAQRAFFETYPAAQCFAVVSWGCAATSWLAKQLNAHPEIFCVHASNAFWKQLGGAPELSAVDYVKLLACQGYAHRAAGDVHGIAAGDVASVRDAFGERFGCAVVVREPLPRLLSQMGLFDKLGYSRGWDVGYVNAFVEGKVRLPNQDYQTKLFVHGVNLLNNVLAEREVAPIHRCEDLTSDARALGEFVNVITRGRVAPDSEWAREVVESAPLNSHAARDRSRLEDAFEDWQIEVIRKCVEPETWEAYRELGYELPELMG